MINKVIVSDAYPKYCIDEQLKIMINSKVFTILDLKKGYHQIKIHKYFKETTVFSTPRGLF